MEILKQNIFSRFFLRFMLGWLLHKNSSVHYFTNE
jgi:hypothetical protein